MQLPPSQPQCRAFNYTSTDRPHACRTLSWDQHQLEGDWWSSILHFLEVYTLKLSRKSFSIFWKSSWNLILTAAFRGEGFCKPFHLLFSWKGVTGHLHSIGLKQKGSALEGDSIRIIVTHMFSSLFPLGMRFFRGALIASLLSYYFLRFQRCKRHFFQLKSFHVIQEPQRVMFRWPLQIYS